MKLNLFKKKENKSSPLTMDLFYYFSIFTVVLLILLWIFEIGFLGTFYRYSRYKQMTNVGKEITADVLNEIDIEDIGEIARNQNIGTIVINLNSWEVIVANESLIDSIFNKFDLDKLIAKVISSSIQGENIMYITNNGKEIAQFSSHNGVYRTETSGLLYVNYTYNEANEAIVVMVMGSLVPVEATISTIRNQLFLISIILVFISFIISLQASNRIAKPIIQITESAKQLSNGQYDTEFKVEGYQEIEELSSTLNEMARQLEKADQLQKDLVANVSHDLRTPLTMISGYGELIRDIPSEATPENVQVIIDEANRLASLVNNLLDISKLQAGTDSITINNINTNELVYSVYNSFNKVMQSKGFNIELNIEENIYYVAGDYIRLQQVLHNLMNNAINHCGEDKVVVLSCRKKGKVMRFDVIDHGEGIKQEDIPLIWQRYYKADHQKRYELGSGLGLSIVKTILEMHKAKYGVESKENEGSDFYFELPIVEN